MGYHLNLLDEPVFIAVSKPLLTEFGIHPRLESGDISQLNSIFNSVNFSSLFAEGDVCLSILRNSSVGNDGTGWTPARRLKDVIWGLNSLFTDLLNFDDPLNIEAAEHFQVNQMHSLFVHF